jgi:hypothetical protein
MRSWLGVEAVMTAAVALREALGGAAFFAWNSL